MVKPQFLQNNLAGKILKLLCLMEGVMMKRLA
jgi:hypothetical protein